MADKTLGKKTSAIDDQLNAILVFDENDPIFDSESENDDCFYTIIDVKTQNEERANLNATSQFSVGHQLTERSALTVDQYIKQINDMLEAYAASQDFEELSSSLNYLNSKRYNDLFIVSAVRIALDKDNEFQKILSGNLTLLYLKNQITKQQFFRAFEKLVQSCDDIKLDVPNVSERLYLFMECAVYDGCVDGSLLHRLPEVFLLSLPESFSKYNHIKKQLQEIHEFKGKCRSILEEFFNSGSADECDILLKKLNQPLLQHEFVKLLIVASFEKTDNEREMVSSMLDRLYGIALKPDDIQIGFSRLIGCIDDISLDTPKALEFLCKFLARSIVDEILPPSFLGDRYRLHFGGDVGMSVLKKTQKWITNQNGAAALTRFRKIWRSVDNDNEETRQFRKQLHECILEYYYSRDCVEATCILQKMCLSPDQLVECVRKIIIYSMEIRKEKAPIDDSMNLLGYLSSQDIIDDEFLLQGFVQIHEKIEDLKIDIPHIEELFEKYVDRAKEENLLPKSYRPFVQST